jgi:REP element-mobilizing transposase RayT
MEYYGTFLPHIQPFFAKFFVTIVLYDEIIIDYYKQITLKKNQEIEKIKGRTEIDFLRKVNINKKYFKLFDDFLPNSTKKYLIEPEIAQIVINRLKKFDGIYYDLLSFCIMPNHVHFLIDTDIQKHFFAENEEVTLEKYFTIQKIMQAIKGGSSREINIARKTKGTVWLKDYWDHYIRTDIEEDGVID